MVWGFFYEKNQSILILTNKQGTVYRYKKGVYRKYCFKHVHLSNFDVLCKHLTKKFLFIFSIY